VARGRLGLADPAVEIGALANVEESVSEIAIRPSQPARFRGTQAAQGTHDQHARRVEPSM